MGLHATSERGSKVSTVRAPRGGISINPSDLLQERPRSCPCFAGETRWFKFAPIRQRSKLKEFRHIGLNVRRGTNKSTATESSNYRSGSCVCGGRHRGFSDSHLYPGHCSLFSTPRNRRMNHTQAAFSRRGCRRNVCLLCSGPE